MDCSFASSMLKTRAAGVLLHVSSLPGCHGIGDIGAGARTFVDWLARYEIGLWQVLPLNPNGRGNAPYSSWSAFCGNPLFIDLDALVAEGFLDADNVKSHPEFSNSQVNFPLVTEFKMPLLRQAAKRFLLENRRGALFDAYQLFVEESAAWLEDAVLFRAIQESRAGQPWWEWPRDLRDRDRSSLRLVRDQLAERVEQDMVIQFFFEMQWKNLRAYAAERGVRIVGDVPIYVDRDSADVWANPEMFRLDKERIPTVVAGVPPDAFSELGQLWGNPIFDWRHCSSRGYAWWVSRFSRVFSQTDVVRIDHFRGFAEYWEIPYGAPDARQGKWVTGPGHDFVRSLRKAFNGLPFIAEDLGIIDDKVRDLRDAYELPGMLVMQFAFGGKPTNEYLPHNHVAMRAVYPGTHDNSTLLGWWRALSAEQRNHVVSYCGLSGGGDEREVLWTLLRQTLNSVAMWGVIPVQDLLELDDGARMNNPATGENGGNWVWRMTPDSLGSHVGERFHHLLKLSGRAHLFVKSSPAP